ncbi:MAG: S9 family peptidase [Planctomycetes bacterium]|nr:S9 family peptidase [Planctomycetota bacterium]
MRLPLFALMLFTLPALGADSEKLPFQLKDVFQMELARDPQISPDGKKIVYARNFMDIMKDRRRSNLWLINTDGSNHQALTTGNVNDSSPRWSPDGKQIVYVSSRDGTPQLNCLWLESNRSAALTKLTSAPSNPRWSPDGKQIAFMMAVPEKVKPYVDLPPAPPGAEWAPPPKVIQRTIYRFDGQGYLKDAKPHLFVMPAEGGTPRQLTKEPLDLGGSFRGGGRLEWTPDSKALFFSANRFPENEDEPLDTDIYEVSFGDGRITKRTDRRGPDHSPAVSPDGTKVAYLGFDDRRQGYQITHLYIMNRDGTNQRMLTGSFDRDIQSPVWNKDGTSLFVQFDDQGDTKLGNVSLDGKVTTLTGNVGGLSLDRPYSGGSYSASKEGSLAFTLTSPDHPADVAIVSNGGKPRRLTNLNQGLLDQRSLASTEEIRWKSSYDKREIHGWIVKPPNFDANRKYPLILEIHGGPFANYGPRFALENQQFAAAGYVVFYTNPRGSTSYGEEFGNLIHHAYPGNDYDDLMSGIDAVVAKGYIDRKKLFVTGGSGGGVLTAWIVGKTDRFAGAVVGKPVINWYSFVLTSDAYPFFSKYWFPGPPWEHAEHYLKRSPLSLVGNVKTPTMVVTGEEDYRTPISESEQYYQALKLRKVDTALVRIPGASHDYSARPSQAMARTACVLKWFETHKRTNGVR